MGVQKKEGCISGCDENSGNCRYRCCDQSSITDDDFCPENSILLYPGEWELESEDRKRHILISDSEHNGGKLGCCDKANFDQSKCNQNTNFKPMDCKSYPFFPVLEDGKIKLAIDSERCPLSENIEQLHQHYMFVLSEWEKIAENNVLVRNWIKSLNLHGYRRIDKF